MGWGHLLAARVCGSHSPVVFGLGRGRLSLDPRVFYRGIGVNLCSEMGSMALQFGLAGWIKRVSVGDEVRPVSRQCAAALPAARTAISHRHLLRPVLKLAAISHRRMCNPHQGGHPPATRPSATSLPQTRVRPGPCRRALGGHRRVLVVVGEWVVLGQY